MVLLVATLIGAYVARDVIAKRTHQSRRELSPPAQGGLAAGAEYFGAFYGNAPWALSALPECFRQTGIVTGRPSFVRQQLSPRWSRIGPETLRYADCAVIVRSRDVLVRRGSDRFRIPAPAELLRNGPALGLLRQTRVGAELRFYAASNR